MSILLADGKLHPGEITPLREEQDTSFYLPSLSIVPIIPYAIIWSDHILEYYLL